MSLSIRNRIRGHRRVRAGDLVPHELNPRRHSDAQRHALAALYEEVGFARSLLAYELPDGRLKLIDGHLRQAMDPNMEVDVEVLEVSDAEARTLLLSLDPLVRLAEYDARRVEELRQVTPTDSAVLREFWDTLAQSEALVQAALAEAKEARPPVTIPEQYLILVECASDEEQVELLERFRHEGLRCRALIS